MGVPFLFWDVDTQIDFMRAEGRLYVPDAESIIPNLRRLTQAAIRLLLPVVASADDHEASDAEISSEPDFRITFPPHCLRGTEGAERIAETRRRWTLKVSQEPIPEAELERGLDQPAPAVLILKKRFDVFSNPNCERVLQRLDPARIAVYGVALDVCNRAAVEGLLARGYGRVTLVTDATRALDAERAEQLRADWRERGVEERTTSELLSELSGDESRSQSSSSSGSRPSTS